MDCRACKYNHTNKYYDFGLMPLSNNFNRDYHDAINCEKYPLTLYRCPKCELSQLSEVINPDKLYSYYTYRSSMSQTYKDHCLELAHKVKELIDDSNRVMMIDIAGNDGTLLLEFKKVINGMPLVVDPAANLLRHAQNSGCAIYGGYWNNETATIIKNSEIKNGRFIDGATVVTATNVIAHVNDLHDFMAGVKTILAPDGVFIVEFPHAVDFIQKCEFDTTYFEHLSYMTLKALIKVADDNDLQIFDAYKIDIHGGTLRVWICHKLSREISNTVQYFINLENSIFNDKVYDDFVIQANNKISEVSHYLFMNNHKKIIGFAASAKGNILLNCLDRDLLPKYILDETPEKIGKFSPGIGLEIKSLESEDFNGVDIVMILAWNFEKEITEKLRKSGFKGEIYCPL